LSVICVGGHPDDPESGCGGTLARYTAAGHRVTIIYLTRGVPLDDRVVTRGHRHNDVEAKLLFIKMMECLRHVGHRQFGCHPRQMCHSPL